MKSVVNSICSFLKYILLIMAFSLNLYIVLKMNKEQGINIVDSIFIFMPYMINLILFILNIILDRKKVTKNIFFNVTAVIIFTAIIMIFVRTIYDNGMLFNTIQGKHINSIYINDNLAFIKIMLYGLIFNNFLLMFIPNSY